MRAGDESALVLRTPDGQTLVFDPDRNVNELSAAVSSSLSPWAFRIDTVWLTHASLTSTLELLNERIPVTSVVLAPVVYQTGADRKPFTVPSGIEAVKLKSNDGLQYGTDLEIRIVAESPSATALLISYNKMKVLVPGGVDFALIKETTPDALRDLSIIVVGEDDISYIPPRVWQALEPTAIAWNSTAVSPVVGWLSLDGGEVVSLVSDGSDFYFVND